jgi:hypothetical protein
MSRIRKGVAVLAVAISCLSSWAILPGIVTSSWPWAGKIGSFASYNTSGVAIGDHWILTVRHAVFGMAPGDGRFQLDDGSTYSSIAIYWNANDDIALVQVAETLPGWYDPYWGLAETGQVVELVGYGNTGTFSGGTWSFSGAYGTKRRGMNKVSGIQFADFGGSPAIRGTWLIYDFDGPSLDWLGDGGPVADECTLGGGDSGGPTFLNDGGVWKVAGLHSWIGSFGGGPSAPQYGSALGDIRLGSYRSWFESIVPAEVFPNSMSLFRGAVVSGVLADVNRPDDSRLVLRPGVVFSSSEAPVQLILSGTSPVASTTSLRFCLEAQASAPNITQTTELYNFSSGVYVPVDTRTAAMTDSLVEIVNTTNPSEFIETGTRTVRARIIAKAQGPVFAFPWLVRIDRAVWNIKR